MSSVPIAADVFTWPSDDPQLIGGRCEECAAVIFPVQESCSRCGSLSVVQHLLPRRGVIWTWTTQEFLPKHPYTGGETLETFRPYGVGLIDLGEVKIESRLTEADPEKLTIGAPVELTIIPFRSDGDTEVVSYAFKPI